MSGGVGFPGLPPGANSGNGVDPSTSGVTGVTDNRVATAQGTVDGVVFQEAMRLAVYSIAFDEAMPTSHETPARAIARRLPGSPENPDGVMKEARAEMEVWEQRREFYRRMMRQLDEMIYGG